MTAGEALLQARRLAVVFVVGAAGGGVFALLGLPAAWLAGAMFACGVGALAGLTATIPNRLRDVVYVVLGVTMGAGVTPEVIDQMPTWPVTLAGLLATTALVTAASYLYLRRFARWDPASAFFGAVPGALTLTIAMAERSPADLRLVALAQTVRLFMLVAVLPFVVAAVHPEPGLAMSGPEGLAGTAVLMVAGTAGSLLFMALRVPSGLLLGAFFASSLLHGLGVIGGQVSPIIQIPAFVILGASLGLRFAGTTFRQLRVMLTAVVGVFAVALATACAGAVLLSLATGVSLGQMLVAFAPGGLEAMVIVAFALSVDPAFVAAHHLLRFLAVTLLVPVIGPLVWGRGQPSSTKVSDAD